LASLLPNAAWGRLAVEWLKAKDDPALARVFVNTVLGEPWREDGDTLDGDALAARGEPWSIDGIPEQVLLITIGADLQDDRAECTVCGWDRQNVCYVLDHLVLYGSPATEELWAQVDELLRSRWPSKLGGSLRVDAACLDAGDGEHFAATLQFCGRTIPGFGCVALMQSSSASSTSSRAAMRSGFRLRSKRTISRCWPAKD
jgi:phage terminase large subunit GpA-like protein